MAQKVKVQCCYWGPVWSEKVGWWISNRSGWLLELLTELKMSIYCPQGSGTLCQQLTIQHILHILHYLALSCTILYHFAPSCTILLHPVPSCTILNHFVPSCTILHHLAPSCTILHHLVPSCTMLHHVAPYCTMLHHVAYMQKAGDSWDISPQIFLDFLQNFRLRTRNQYCTQAIAWGSTI